MVWTLGDCYGTVDFVYDKGIGLTDTLLLVPLGTNSAVSIRPQSSGAALGQDTGFLSCD